MKDELGAVKLGARGIEFPADLPGIEGVVQARKQIGVLQQEGYSQQEALKIVKENYYNDLGALALRAQLNDTLVHIFGDPLNVLQAYIKPVDMLRKSRLLAMTAKIAPDTLEYLHAQAKIAEAAGDLVKAAEIAKQVDTLRDSGKVMGLGDKLAIFFTGGDELAEAGKAPWYMSNWVENVANSKVPVVNKVAKSLTLTPEAKAYETLTVVADVVDAQIFQRTDDPAQIVRAIEDATDEILGSKYGHAFLTPEGRIAQAALSNGSVEAKALLGQYNAILDERLLLNDIARALGESPTTILQRIVDDGPEVLARHVTQVGAQNADSIAARLADDIIIKNLNDVHKKGLPYSPELFKYTLSMQVKEAAEKMAIMRFGVQNMGIIRKASEALKAAETLAFLRLNPGYAVRNFLNNEFTILARGLNGFVPQGKIDELVDVLGFTPHRLAEAFTMTGDTLVKGAKGTYRPGQKIQEVLVGEKGFLDNFREKVRDINPPVDFSNLAMKVEESASKRAFYSGYMQGWRKYFWTPGQGFTRLADFIPSGVLGDDVLESLERAVGDAISTKQLRGNLKANSNTYPSRIISQTSDDLGYSLDSVFDHDLIGKIESELAEVMTRAADEGPHVVTKYFGDLRDDFASSLEDAAKTRSDTRIAYAKTLIEGQGPMGISTLMADAQDELAEAHISHFMRMQRLNVKGLDGDLARNFWQKVERESGEFYGRHWSRFEDTMTGLKLATDEIGYTVPDGLLNDVQGWRNGWGEFIDYRNTEYRSFFDALAEGMQPKKQWAALQEELGALYNAQYRKEYVLTQQIDDTLVDLLSRSNPEMGEAFAAWRKITRDSRLNDRQNVLEFRKQLQEAETMRAREELYWNHWRDRIDTWVSLRDNERAGLVALMGDNQVADTLRGSFPGEGRAALNRSLASRYGIGTATESGVPNDKYLVNIVNKYMRGEYGGEVIEGAFSKLDDIPSNLAADALEARRVSKGLDEVSGLGDELKDFQPVYNVRDYLEKDMELDVLHDQGMNLRGWEALDGLERSAMDAHNKPPVSISEGLSKEQMQWVDRYLGQVENDMSQAVNASLRFAEFRRDAALLNYTRRKHYNVQLGVFLPYSFWATETFVKTMLHTVDYPTMMTTYLRLQKMIQTAGAPEAGFPSRLRKSIRVPAPFLPDWMGNELFVDPFRVALPYDALVFPYERFMQQRNTHEGRAERILEARLAEGAGDAFALRDALETRSGPEWEAALVQAQQEYDDGDNFFDLVSMFSSPHAPLVWGMKSLTGDTDEIGPSMPLSRTVKQFYGLLGIDPITHPAFGTKAWNVGASIRQSLGLPAFDQWDPYRIDRMLANMTAAGEISVTEARRAMIEREGDIYNRAADMAAQEYAKASIAEGDNDLANLGTFILGSVGIPMQVYPEGEQKQRELQVEFSKAYAEKEAGDETALREFFDDHPEYEARMALWDEPEERLHSFLVDQVWDTYHETPGVHKKQFGEAFGDEWDIFVSDDHQGESISSETLQVWLKLMGGDPPGSMSMPAIPVDLAPEEIAWRAQVFYDMRKDAYPDYYEMQQGYYEQKEGKDRRDYLRTYPDLKAYWDWRRDFLTRNPDLVPFIDDDFEPKRTSYAQQQLIQNTQPLYNWAEWQKVLPADVLRGIESGYLSDSDASQMERNAELLGISPQQLVSMAVDALEREK